MSPTVDQLELLQQLPATTQTELGLCTWTCTFTESSSVAAE